MIEKIADDLKSARFRLVTGQKLTELAEVVGDYHGFNSNSTKLPGEKLLSYWGFRTDARTLTESKIRDEIVKNLDILSVQTMNLLRFHERAEEISEDLVFTFSKLGQKAKLDSKLLIYIKARVEFNSKMFGLDENYYPKQLYTYNDTMLNVFKNTNKTFVFFDTFKDLANAPSKRMVRKMKIKDTAVIGSVVIHKPSFVKKDPTKILSQRKIALLY